VAIGPLMLAVERGPTVPEGIAFGLLALLCVVAGITDWRAQKIYNWLTYPAILAGLVLWMAVGAIAEGGSGALSGLVTAFVVMLVAAVPAVLLFSLGAIGGGDVKLLAAVGAITADVWCVRDTVFFGLVVAFLMAVFLMIRHRRVKLTLGRIWGALLGAFARIKPDFPRDGPPVPLGAAFKVGGLIAGAQHLLHVRMPWSNW
jgi:prepilin peptidase CpaA